MTICEDYIFPPRDPKRGTLVTSLSNDDRIEKFPFSLIPDYPADDRNFLARYRQLKGVAEWCAEHFVKEEWCSDGVTFSFMHERDAILFKLRWVG